MTEKHGNTGPLVTVDQLTVTYAAAAAPALDGVSFALAKGEALGIYGPSGSGKSTLALALAGLLPPGATVAARRFEWEGRSLLGLPERGWRPLRGAEIACVFQQPFLALSPWRQVGDQVADVLRAHSALAARAAGEKTRHLFAEFGLDPTLAEAFPHQLSGGQRQRVVFCQALAAGPRLLIADEPTASLDDDSRDRLLELVGRLRRERGLTLLWISHDAEVLERMTDRILVLDGGRQTAAAIAAPAWPPPPSPPAADAEILAAARVTIERGRGRFFERRRRRQVLLDQADFSLRRGEIVGLHGDSGSGKTTLLRCLAGLLPPTRGRVEIAGQDVATAGATRRRALRRQIQMVGQDPVRWVDPRWPLWRTVAEGLLDQPERSEVPLRDRAAAAIAELGLGTDLLDRRPSEVSGGQLQRALLARALLCGARALLLDEAFSALDPERRAALLDLLLDLRERHGLALLLVSHQKSWLRAVCTRTLEMRPGGRLLPAPE